MIGKMLAVNQTLKYLSLEGNNLLTSNDESGIKSLLNALKNNTSLIYLNLNSTHLIPSIGNLIIDLL